MLVQIDGFCLCLLVMKHVNPIPNLLSRCIYMAPKPDGVRLDGLCEGGVLGYYHCFFQWTLSRQVLLKESVPLYSG